MFDFRAGIRGDITDKIGFDVYGARGISDKFQAIQNYVLLSRVRQAVLATSTTSCLDPSNGCVPLDIFGQTGTITPAMANFVSQQASTRVKSVLSQAHATINGDTPLQLWAKNPVSFAFGTEYRKYTATQRSDALSKTAGELGGAGGAAPDITGGLDVYEGFAEIVAPIVSDRPFFDELQLEAGIRRSHYTINATPADLAAVGLGSEPKFNTTTWKVAGSWAPVRDLKFRANYNHAVRAPNIAELFTPQTTVLTNLAQDPCALGLPVGECQPDSGLPRAGRSCEQDRDHQQSDCWPGQHHDRRQPQPEARKGQYLDGGCGDSSALRPGLQRDDRLLPYQGDQRDHAADARRHHRDCFANVTAASATNPACTVIRRNPITGQLDGSPADTPGLFGALSNNGKITTDGVDLTVDYRHNLGTFMGTPAKIALNFGGNWTHSQKFQATPTSDNRECVGFYSANCGFPAGGLLPKYTWNQRTTLSLGKLDLSVLWRHLSGMSYEGIAVRLACARIHRRFAARALASSTCNAACSPARSPVAASLPIRRCSRPRNVQRADGRLQPHPGVQLLRLRGPVQRQRAFRPDVHGHEPARQEAADRGQHRRHDVAE